MWLIYKTGTRGWYEILLAYRSEVFGFWLVVEGTKDVDFK